MDKKINLSQLADLLAQAGGMSKSASEQFVKNFFDIISQNVISDGLVKVKGLGTFKLIQMEDRESVNVNTGERFTIEGHQKISFTPDTELKERINKPFASFEIVEITEQQADELAAMDDGATESVNETTTGIKPVAVQPDSQSNGHSEPSVKDITQGRGVRFLLKLLVWIFSIILCLALALYLFWPLIGVHVLGFVEQNLKQTDKTELVTDPLNSIVKPSQETVSVKKENTTIQESRQEDESVSQPQQNAMPAEIPEPAVTTQAVLPVPEVESQGGNSLVVLRSLQLNSQDQAKPLAEFTEADTVNFIMDGELTVHTFKSGETVARLALKYYGSKKLWPYILKYNNIKDASKIYDGARIRIPVLKAR